MTKIFYSVNMNRFVYFILLLAFSAFSWSFPVPLQSAQGDPYEPDNSHGEAQDIGIYEIDQVHTFHQNFDEDWVQFTGGKSYSYTYRATNPSSTCDPVIELYAGDGTTLLMRINESGPGIEEALDWICPADGVYFLRYTNNSVHYDPSVIYKIVGHFNVSGPSMPGYLSGRVTSSGSGIGGATLRASNGAGSSQADGSYVLGLNEGAVNVNVHKDGYHSQSFTVTIVEDQTTQRNIALEKIEAANQPPSISGTPITETMTNYLYSFRPTASDPEEDSYSFSINNKPSWASFNTENGMLLGRTNADTVGVHGPITITVTDSRGASASLEPFSIEVHSIAYPGINFLLSN